jgi:hypothetical protein
MQPDTDFSLGLGAYDHVTVYLDTKGEFTFIVEEPLLYVSEYWSDTGWETDVTQEPVLAFVEAINDEGELFEPTKAQIDEARELAVDAVYESHDIQP